MKRRGFLRSIAAVSTLAAMPSGIAMTARASVVGAAPIVRANLYTWSAMIARTKGAVSPELLIKTLNVDPARAEFLFGRLVSNNVVNMSGTTIVNQTRAILNSNHNSKVDIPNSKSNMIVADDEELTEIGRVNEDAIPQKLSSEPILDGQSETDEGFDTKT